MASSPENSGGEVETSVVVTGADVGKRVVFFSSSDKREKYGTLRYYGRPEFASSGVWCGVELDRPEGRNNGSKHGIRYFTCGPSYGVFVPVERVQRDSSHRSRSRLSSRPNSRPNSRPSSAERTGRKGVEPIEGHRVKPAVVQQELARLVQHVPVTDHVPRRKTATNSVTGSRQPMKAFARTKDDTTIGSKSSSSRPRPTERGMHRAASSENLRGIKESNRKSVKKSSSEQNLKGGNTLPRPPNRQRRQSRPQSVSGGESVGGECVLSSSSSSDSSSPTGGQPPANSGFVTSAIGYLANSGLSTHTSQFAEQERHSSGICTGGPSQNGGQSKQKLALEMASLSHPLSHVAGRKADPTLQMIVPLLKELLDQNQKLMHRQGKFRPSDRSNNVFVVCRGVGAKVGGQ